MHEKDQVTYTKCCMEHENIVIQGTICLREISRLSRECRASQSSRCLRQIEQRTRECCVNHDTSCPSGIKVLVQKDHV